MMMNDNKREILKIIKTGLCITILAFTSFSYAQATHSGFYGSLTGTKIWLTSHHQIIQRSNPNNNRSIIDKENEHGYGVRGGYLWRFPSFVVALEIPVNVDKIDHEFQGTTTKTIKRMNHNIGLQLVSGPQLTDNLRAYGLVGITYGQFEFEARGTRNSVLNKYYEPGGRIGGGLSFQLTNHISLFTEYAYTRFASHNNISGNSGFYKRDGYFTSQALSIGGTWLI